LDRDGVINFSRPDYVKSLEELLFLPGAPEAIARLSRAGWTTVVVSNQAGVGKGLFSIKTLEKIHAQVKAAVEARGGEISAIYVCPHRAEEGCNCRKPNPGLLLQAAQDLGLDLSACYLVGDRVQDLEAAAAAGCVPILVGEKYWVGPPEPAMEVRDLAEASSWITQNG